MALPDYLQDTAKDYARQLTATTSAPIDTSKFTGRSFVAGEDPLQTQAINLATARYWFLSTIFYTSTTTNTGPGAGAGAGSIASVLCHHINKVLLMKH